MENLADAEPLDLTLEISVVVVECRNSMSLAFLPIVNSFCHCLLSNINSSAFGLIAISCNEKEENVLQIQILSVDSKEILMSMCVTSPNRPEMRKSQSC